MRQKLFDAVLENRLLVLGVGGAEVVLQPLALYVTAEDTETLCGIALGDGIEEPVNLPLAAISTAKVTEIESVLTKGAMARPKPGARRIIAAVAAFVG